MSLQSSSSPASITGKYFILHQRAGGGQTAIFRGRIAGPVVHDAAPYYLCRMYGADRTKLDALAHDTILTVDQLCGIPLYDDIEIWHVEWDKLTRLLDVAAKAQTRADAATKRANEAPAATRIVELQPHMPPEEIDALLDAAFGPEDDDEGRDGE